MIFTWVLFDDFHSMLLSKLTCLTLWIPISITTVVKQIYNIYIIQYQFAHWIKHIKIQYSFCVYFFVNISWRFVLSTEQFLTEFCLYILN